jgi:hypothetical protein
MEACKEIRPLTMKAIRKMYGVSNVFRWRPIVRSCAVIMARDKSIPIRHAPFFARGPRLAGDPRKYGLVHAQGYR